MTKNDKELLGIFLGLGAFFLAVVAIPDKLLQQYNVPDLAIKICLFAGITCAIVVLIIPFRSSVRRLLTKTMVIEYETRYLNSNELQWVLDYTKEILPDFAPSYERMKSWYDRNPFANQIVVQKITLLHSRKEKIIGFFTMTPVNEKAKKLLFKNNLAGRNLDEEYITPNGGHPAAMYIGSVISAGRKEKYKTLLAVNAFMNAQIANKVTTFFTNPVTPDGLRLALKHGFKPVIEHEEKEIIYFKDYIIQKSRSWHSILWPF